MNAERSNPVVDYLAALRATVRRRLFAYGVFAVLAGGVVAFLTVLGLDWMLGLPPVLRLVGGVLFTAGFVAATVYWIILPLRARIGVEELASQLERRFHRLQDQLSSAVHFLRYEQAGSPAMVRRVIADTEKMIQDLPLEAALAAGPLSLRAVLFSVGAVILLAVSLLAPSWLQTGVARYADPWGPVEWPRRVEIRALTHDQLVPLGEAAVVRMAVSRGLHDGLRGIVYLRDQDGNTQALALQRDHEGIFSTTVDAVTEDLTYWFEADDDNTKPSPSVLRAIRRPELVEALATVHPPPYAMGRASKTVDLTEGPATAVVGAEVAIHLRASKPLAADASVGLRTDSGSLLALSIDPQDPHACSAHIEVTGDVSVRPELRDEQGFSNRGGAGLSIRAVPDQPPAVTLLEPPSMVESTPAGSLRVTARVEDDFGVQRVALLAEGFRDGRTLEIPLVGRPSTAVAQDGIEVLAAHAWDFGSLSVVPGDVIVGNVIAVDNRGGDDGQTSRSAPFRIKFISQSEFEVRVREELTVLESRLRQAILDQAGLRDRTVGVVQLGDATPLTDADRDTVSRVSAAQTRLSQQIRELAGRLQELVARMNRNHAGDDQDRQRLSAAGDVLRRVALEVMSEAAFKLGRVHEQTAANDQQVGLQASAALQEEAVERLNAVLQSMSHWGAFAGLLARTRDLLDRQNAVRAQTAELGPQMLGRPVESLTGPEATLLKRLERQQEQIADDVDRHLANLEQLAESTREKDPSGAEAIENAVRVGRAHEVGKRTRAAVDAIRNNRTAGAGMDQKAAAEAMRKMVTALRERDERELAQLRKNLERAEDLVAALLEEQRSLRAATSEAEQVGADEPAFDSFADQQHLLSRNTRLLGEELMELPRAMMPARRVTQAAEPMARAEAQLRGRQASFAIAPQDEAIQHLSDALLALEALAREGAEEAFRRTITHLQEELEAIAGAERTIHEGVEKLRTTLGEASRLGRLETREAARLAREQGEVQQATADLMPDLQKVPVYNWAIQRVAQWMDTSRAQLEGRQIDDELVANTSRIVRELEKLIGALIETQNLPGVTEFAEAQSQGGGQEGETAPTASVPTVAELLVLKAMQWDINQRTQTFDAGFDADSATEAQLRQLAILGEDQSQVRHLTELVIQKAQDNGP